MYERVLLQTIKFDLQVEHPYGTLLKIGKLLKGETKDFMCFLFSLSYIENSLFNIGDKGKIQKLVQMAWTFVNDR